MVTRPSERRLTAGHRSYQLIHYLVRRTLREKKPSKAQLKRVNSADLTILSEDPSTVAPENMRGIGVGFCGFEW